MSIFAIGIIITISIIIIAVVFTVNTTRAAATTASAPTTIPIKTTTPNDVSVPISTITSICPLGLSSSGNGVNINECYCPYAGQGYLNEECVPCTSFGTVSNDTGGGPLAFPGCYCPIGTNWDINQLSCTCKNKCASVGGITTPTNIIAFDDCYCPDGYGWDGSYCISCCSINASSKDIEYPIILGCPCNEDGTPIDIY